MSLQDEIVEGFLHEANAADTQPRLLSLLNEIEWMEAELRDVHFKAMEKFRRLFYADWSARDAK